MSRPGPLSAALRSLLLPGWGQLANGERGKGIVVLCMDAGILAALLLATVGPAGLRSTITVWMLGFAYLFVVIPSALDAYQTAAGIARPLLSGQGRMYVLFMLATVGPGAIPLLWHNARFSRPAKILLSVAVVLIGLSMIWFSLVVGPMLTQIVNQSSADDAAMRDVLEFVRPSP